VALTATLTFLPTEPRMTGGVVIAAGIEIGERAVTGTGAIGTGETETGATGAIGVTAGLPNAESGWSVAMGEVEEAAARTRTHTRIRIEARAVTGSFPPTIFTGDRALVVNVGGRRKRRRRRSPLLIDRCGQASSSEYASQVFPGESKSESE